MSSLDVANEIARQMGGMGRLRSMIGAKDFVGSENSFQFKWAAKSRNGANAIRIELNALDYYDLEFFAMRQRYGVPRLVKRLHDIGAEQLVETFEHETGLYLRL